MHTPLCALTQVVAGPFKYKTRVLCDDNVEPYSKKVFVIFSPKMFTQTRHFRGGQLRTIHSKIYDINGPKDVALNGILLLTSAVVECCFTST